MSWNNYPALGECCYTETLPNGLRLRVVPKPGFAGKFAFLGVNFGSCDTKLPLSGGWQTVPDGTAHFLEHRMFCLPGCDPEAEFSRLGAESNAFTDYAMTGYYFTCTDRFDDCLRLLGDRKEKVLLRLMERIRFHLQYRAGDMEIGCAMFSKEYGLLGKTENAEALVKLILNRQTDTCFIDN